MDLDYVQYSRHGPGNTHINVRSMRGNERLFEAWIKSMKMESFEIFANACPIGEDGIRDTKTYVDNFDPNFVARTYVVRSVMRPLTPPESLRGDVESFPEKIDASPQELVLLKVMGYSRWDEVKSCTLTRKDWKPDSLSPSKRFLLQELGILDISEKN
jgi:hypothetical protein